MNANQHLTSAPSRSYWCSPNFYGYRICVGRTGTGARYVSAIREARSGPVTANTAGLHVFTSSIFDDLSVARSYSRSNG